MNFYTWKMLQYEIFCWSFPMLRAVLDQLLSIKSAFLPCALGKLLSLAN